MIRLTLKPLGPELKLKESLSLLDRTCSGLEDWYRARDKDLLDNSSGGVSKTKVRPLIQKGFVSINGRTCRYDAQIIKKEDIIEICFEPKSFLSEVQAQDSEFAMSESYILFRDKNILVINKPAGVPVEPTRVKSRPSVYKTLQAWLGEEIELGLPHRLDKDTSGVLLCTLNKEASRHMQTLFAQRIPQKTYLALATSLEPASVYKPGYSCIVDSPLIRASAASAQAKWATTELGSGSSAQTEILVLATRITEEGKQKVLFQASPRTGRTHQIRVHLASLGFPLDGDALYGSRASASRVLLHAACLDLRDEISSAITRFEAPLPKDFCEALDKAGIAFLHK